MIMEQGPKNILENTSGKALIQSEKKDSELAHMLDTKEQ